MARLVWWGLLLGLWGGQIAAAAAAVPELRSYCRRAPTRWLRAAHPHAGDYCRKVALGRARLFHDTERAGKAATVARALLPDGLEARLLHAQALGLSARPGSAHSEFEAIFARLEAARSRDLGALVFLSAARAAMARADYSVSLARYRQTILRLEQIGDSHERAKVLFEAATAAAYADPRAGRESRAYLKQAELEVAPLLDELLPAAFALSWYRDRELARARDAARRVGQSWAIHYVTTENKEPRGKPGETLPVLPQGEVALLACAIALAVEPEELPSHVERFLKTRAAGAPPWLSSFLRPLPPQND